MKIYLAPMEGVVNARMRAMLTASGGLDRCVTEFVRVTTQLLPARVFYRFCPELAHGSTTPSGTPVYLQLLGSDPTALAENAARAAELGAAGIDLNFGCPAKTVNKHRGGSILLNEPELVFQIVSQVRVNLPEATPLSVKIRLGYEDTRPFLDVARAVDSAGASELIVHARTKSQGYKPPAYWTEIAALREAVRLPVVANGDIWNLSHYRQCVSESLCENVMIGRGLLAQPGLARGIKSGSRDVMPWNDILLRLIDFQRDLQRDCDPKHACGPLKQWLAYLQRQYPQAQNLFGQVKRITAAKDMLAVLEELRHTNGIVSRFNEIAA